MNMQEDYQYLPSDITEVQNAGLRHKERFTTTSRVPVRSQIGIAKPASKTPTKRSSKEEDKFTSSISIFQAEKGSQPTVVPKEDIVATNRQPRSSKCSVTILPTRISQKTCNPHREERERSDMSQRYVSRLRTSLSTEWMTGSPTGSSLEVDCNSPTSQATENAASTPIAATMEDILASENKLDCQYESIQLIVPQIPKQSARYAFKGDNVSVRVQQPRRHCVVNHKNAVWTHQQQLNNNSNLSRQLPVVQELPCQPLATRKRSLPKSYFAAKLQKASTHRSVVINPVNQERNSCLWRVADAAIDSASVVVQGKQKLGQFIIQAKTPQKNNARKGKK